METDHWNPDPDEMDAETLVEYYNEQPGVAEAVLNDDGTIDVEVPVMTTGHKVALSKAREMGYEDDLGYGDEQYTLEP